MNKGFDTKTISEYRNRIQASGTSYVLSEEGDNTDECVHFYFIGKHEGREVIFDAMMYTLRLQHQSELFEIAEERAAKHFPGYGEAELSAELEEEIGLFIAEVIVTLEEEGEVQVQEHADLDEEADFGVGLDIGLNVKEITPPLISSFITQFNDDTLKLDPQHYSFLTEPGEAE